MSYKDNLKPKTSPQARGKLGGIKSAQVRREKKLMSQIYADFLMKEHEIIGKDGLKKKVSGEQLLSGVMSKILSRGDNSSVSLMKEIRESTEGQKLNLESNVPVQIIIEGVKTENTSS